LKISIPGIIGGTISLCVGIFLLLVCWDSYLYYKNIEKYNGRALGQVTKIYSSSAAEDNGKYYIDYTFAVPEGKKIKTGSSISKQQSDILKVGDSLEIRYDLSDYSHSIPVYGGSPSLIFAFFILLLGCVFLVFGVSRLIPSFKRTKINTA
jgi:hypothetical protein